MKNSSMIVKLFTVMSLFLVIPLIIAGLLFNYNMMNYSEKEISKSAVDNLKTVKRMNDLLAESVTKDVVKLTGYNKIDALSNLTQYSSFREDVNHIIAADGVVTLLRDVVNANYRLQSVYVYLEGTDYITTSSRGVVPIEVFEDTNWLSYYQEHRENRAGSMWISRIPSNESLAAQNSENGAYGNNSVITCIYPLTPFTSKLEGVVVVNIYQNEFYRLINNTDFSNSGQVFVINNKGDVVSYLEQSLIGKNISDRPYINKVMEAKDDNGYVIDHVDGKRQIITYYKLAANDWIYLGVYSLDSLMEKANGLMWQIFAIIIAIIVLGSALSYLISRKLYSPLSKLVQNVKARKGIDLTDTKNEMALLSKAFSAIAEQESQLSKILESNKRNLRDSYLLDLIKGDMEQHQNSGSLTDVNFQYEYFICAILAIDKYEEFLAKYPKDQQYYIKMLVVKVCEEVLNQRYVCAGVVYDKGKIAMILNMNSFDEIQDPKMLNVYFCQIQMELSKIIDNTITIAVGTCQEGASGIKLSYNKAEEAVRRKLIFGYGSIIFWNHAESEDSKYYYPYNSEKRIFNYLNLGSIDEIDAEIEGIIEEIKGMPDISCDNILQIFNQLTGSTIKYLVELNINLSDIYGSGFNIYHKLSTRETLWELKCLLMDFYSKIVSYRESQESEERQYVDRIIDYIRMNYNKEIDFDHMAEYTGISYSYIRKIIKQKTGKSVMEYINRIRIEEAKRLLRQTDASLPEIAVTLGYNNDQSFNRFFKKYEGITPGEFRNSK